MPINPLPDRADVLAEEDRSGQQRFTQPWLEFLRSAFYGLFGWKRSYTATASIDFPNIAAGGDQTSDVAVAGVRAGDHVTVSSKTFVNGLGVDGIVPADNTVRVRRFNYSAGAIDPAADDFRIVVFQQ